MPLEDRGGSFQAVQSYRAPARGFPALPMPFCASRGRAVSPGRCPGQQPAAGTQPVGPLGPLRTAHLCYLAASQPMRTGWEVWFLGFVIFKWQRCHLKGPLWGRLSEAASLIPEQPRGQGSPDRHHARHACPVDGELCGLSASESTVDPVLLPFLNLLHVIKQLSLSPAHGRCTRTLHGIAAQAGQLSRVSAALPTPAESCCLCACP